MRHIAKFISLLLCLPLLAHTLVLVKGPRIADANALAKSALFGNNGDGGDAFTTILYPGGNTNAPLSECWSWTAATFTPERRAALTQLANSSAWSNDVIVLDYPSEDGGFPFRVIATNGLALPAISPFQP